MHDLFLAVTIFGTFAILPTVAISLFQRHCPHASDAIGRGVYALGRLLRWTAIILAGGLVATCFVLIFGPYLVMPLAQVPLWVFLVLR